MRKTFVFVILMLIFSLMTGTVSTVAAVTPNTPDIIPLPGQVNPYRTRSELLMEASSYVGVFTPEEAASVWAKGLTHRSAAMQYIVMTENLKKKYAVTLDEANSNWVTGQSSPWVNNFVINDVYKPDCTHAEIKLCFDTMSSAGPYKTFNATLGLILESGFWRIDRIIADNGLEAYT